MRIARPRRRVRSRSRAPGAFSRAQRTGSPLRRSSRSALLGVIAVVRQACGVGGSGARRRSLHGFPLITMTMQDVGRDYITKMLRRVAGMKALLVDRESKTFVSSIYSQTDILKDEVFLVDQIDSEDGEKLLHMKAVCLLRPTYGNLRALW